MPWRLKGCGVTLATLHAVDIERARDRVPPEYRVLPCWPGKTLGGLFVAEYGPGSDLEYSEVIATCATVLCRGRPAAWATHVFVDSPCSVEGGRRLLGVPKHLADFTGEADAGDGLTVSGTAGPILRVRRSSPSWLWPQRIRIAALHRDSRDPSSVVVHGNQIRGRLGVARARVEIPRESPLAELGLGPPLFGLCVRDLDAVFGGAPFLPAHSEAIAPPHG